MAWKEPKTNWTPNPGEFFNIDDWNRIIGNVEYLNDIGNNLFGKISINDILEKKYSDMIYAREINALEENIKLISRSHLFDIDETEVIWRANKAAPSFRDFNRWEKNIFIIHEKIKPMGDVLDYCDEGAYCTENNNEIGGLL